KRLVERLCVLRTETRLMVGAVAAGKMHRKVIDGMPKLLDLIHVIDNTPQVGYAALISADEVNYQLAFLQTYPELDVPIYIIASFIPTTHIIDLEAVLFRTVEPSEMIRNVFVRPESLANPTW